MLYLPDGNVTAPEWSDLARRISEGDGVTWGGDPSLWLGLGVVKRGGKIVGRRLEVWRRTEEGQDVLIGSWHPTEQYRICHDLAQMRVGRPGAISVEDRIDAHNAKLEAAADAKRRDQMALATERLAYAMMRRQGHARNRFGIKNNPLAKD